MAADADVCEVWEAGGAISMVVVEPFFLGIG